MSFNRNRMYLQLWLEDDGSAALKELSDTIGREPRSGNPIWKGGHHLTLIHFGKAQSVLKSIREEVDISYAEYGDRLQTYVEATKKLITDKTYELTPTDYDRIGVNKGMLIVRYRVSEELYRIHDEAYVELLKFIESCGIKDPKRFAENDSNFRLAKTFEPHIIIFKGYVGPDPTVLPSVCHARFAPLVYDKYGISVGRRNPTSLYP